MAKNQHKTATDLYGKIGIQPIIHMTGTTTRYGGTLIRAEAQRAMIEASGALVDINELTVKTGEKIAELLGMEAALITSGAAGALLMQAAAVIAGSNFSKITKLPNTDGMKNEIIMNKAHRMGYDQMYRAAGAEIVEIGLGGGRTESWELEAAIGENTAAVAHIVSPGNGGRGLPLGPTIEIAHKHDIPVLVDAASMLPPRENLYKYIRAGADLVCYSGGKGIRGPQGTGLLLGRSDLIEAARLNSAPNNGVGRSGKVSKEEMMGIVAALEAFLAGDEESEMAEIRGKCEVLVDHLVEVPGVIATVEQDDVLYPTPYAVVRFDTTWRGRSAEQIVQALWDGSPSIRAGELDAGRGITFSPFSPTNDEVETAAIRLREELLKG